MSVEQKIAEAREKIAKRETWGKKIGFWRIMWIFGWGVLAGASWVNVVNEVPSLFETSKTVIIINKAEAKSPEPAKIEADEAPSVKDIADDIWSRESSRGVNNYSKCDAVGKVNGIGYGIAGDGKYRCFESHEDEMIVLEGWIIDKRARGMSDKELMCLYSGSNYNFCK